MNNNEAIVKKNINDIIPNPNQPRKYFNENDLKELSETIKNYGIINPILVRQVGDKFEIIAGERRFRAAKLCGLTEVPVIIKNVTENQSSELALIENLHRQDLTAIEEARYYEEELKRTNITQQELANKIGKSQSSIANKIRLLSLPEEVQQAVIEKKISERHARSLLDVKEKEKQLELLQRIIDEKLTVKETEDLIDLTNTSDEDIEQAIQDIMKSLNISEEKEEKESDNMNNGNFFPNYDNNMMQNNNMNGQMPTNQPINNQENVMPTFMSSHIPAQEPQTPVINPTLDTNVGMQEPVMNTPSFDQPMTEQPMQPMDAPLFNQNDQMPSFGMDMNMAPPVQPTEAPITEPVMDTPLFAPTNTEPLPQAEPAGETPMFGPAPQPEPINESFYEVPVNVSPVIDTPQATDRFTEIENLLSSNGVPYKAYSNDTGHCIIIEI